LAETVDLVLTVRHIVLQERYDNNNWANISRTIRVYDFKIHISVIVGRNYAILSHV